MGYTVEQIQNLLGSDGYRMYEQLSDYILDNYNVNQVWSDGGNTVKFVCVIIEAGKRFVPFICEKNNWGLSSSHTHFT